MAGKKAKPWTFVKRKRKAMLLGGAVAAVKGALGAAGGVAAKAVASKAGLSGLLLNPPASVKRWLFGARAKYHSWLEGVGGKARRYAVTLHRGEAHQPVAQHDFAGRRQAEGFMSAKRAEGYGTALWMLTETPTGIERVQYPSALNTLYFSALVTPPKEVLMATANPCMRARRRPLPASVVRARRAAVAKALGKNPHARTRIASPKEFDPKSFRVVTPGGTEAKKNPDEVSRIIAYEQGELSAQDTIRLFASLIRTGTVWQLQGHYGRTAKALIDAGYISTKGKVLKQVEQNGPTVEWMSRTGRTVRKTLDTAKAAREFAKLAKAKLAGYSAVKVKKNPLLMVVPNEFKATPANTARRVRNLAEMRLRSMGYKNAMKVRRVSFSDLARADAYVVTVLGWKPGPDSVKVRDAIKSATKDLILPSPDDKVIVEFEGPGIIGNPGARRRRAYILTYQFGRGPVRRQQFRGFSEAYNLVEGLREAKARFKLVEGGDILAQTALPPKPRANPGRGLSVPERHQLKVALDTLKMSPATARVMGGMSVAEAKSVLKRVGYSDAQIAKLASNPGQSYHVAEARRYSKLLKSDLSVKHGEAAAYWQGALSAEQKAVLAGKGVRGNPRDDMGSLTRHPEFRKAVALYRKFHGCDPKSIKRVLLPVGDKRKVESTGFFVSLGKAPAESYTPPKRSRKAGSIYVHKYDSSPEKVVSADGKLVATLPGKHRVTDWIRG